MLQIEGSLVGKLVSVPKEVSSTCCIKIMGDQRHLQPERFNSGWKWELQAVAWDLDRNRQVGTWFAVNMEQVNEWLRKNS